MSDTSPETGADGAAANGESIQTPLTIHGQYIKDLSFEVPGAPKIFLDPPSGQPDLDMNLDVQVEGITDETFEVILELKAETKVAGQTAYILELKFAGLFTVQLPEEHRAGALFVECPRLLFPFARAVLADVSRDGGFQPLILGPVDFAQLFEQNLDKIRAQTAE